MNKETENLKNKILESINAGQVKMRPKWHFALRTSLFVLGGILLLSLTLYVWSFVIFALQRSGLWFMPGLGLRAFSVLLTSLPWILILCALIFIVLLEVFVKKFSFGYRKPLLYSALVVIGISFIGGSVIAKTPLHERVSGSFVDKIAPAPANVVVCDVATTTSAGFSCHEDKRGVEKTVEVEISSETRTPAKAEIKTGSTVVIYGEKEADGKISARGVKKIDDKFSHHKEKRGKGKRGKDK